MKARLAIGLLFASLPFSALHAEKSQLHLFLLSGQSNMARLNPDWVFTPTVNEALGESNVLVVKGARGGMPIRQWYKEWHFPDETPKEDGLLYDKHIQKTKDTLGDRKPDTITFVWMQGESDAAKSYHSIYACP